MPTSLTPNPADYVNPASLTKRNLQYGPYDMQRLNVYSNVTRLPGGNPVLVFAHGGAWTGLDKTATIEGDRVVRWLWAYLLDSTNYPTSTVPFDIVSIEYRCQGHKLSAATMVIGGVSQNTPYEPIIEGVNPGYGPGTGTISGPWFNTTQIDDIQRAIQWCKDNADRFGFDPARFIGAGFSAGSAGMLAAAFSPSRHFTTREQSRRRWDTFSSSYLSGVINISGEIDLDPWYMSFLVTRFAFGALENSDLATRADIEKLMLLPDASGLYPEGSPPSALAKALSPIRRIEARVPECLGTRIRSHYIKNLASEETTANVSTYSAIPPYDGGGHDWHQFADLAAVCATAGVDHTGRVIDYLAYSGLQTAWESIVDECYVWMSETVYP